MVPSLSIDIALCQSTGANALTSAFLTSGSDAGCWPVARQLSIALCTAPPASFILVQLAIENNCVASRTGLAPGEDIRPERLTPVSAAGSPNIIPSACPFHSSYAYCTSVLSLRNLAAPSAAQYSGVAAAPPTAAVPRVCHISGDHTPLLNPRFAYSAIW